ncbi:uncharacterized protein EHS24_004882 [Apiotrichum porosum]|uniref:Uncharacterized protein n=1 Tax=Apiotrichum porosum TaxID=105984 RepID=A0A427Y692_9TREE|nr:uncharacterized protein EHS24_004882 [Apiotrichum porosum]RSH86611.1 hypothetical protein EHS24_004882 [Apiotrichum porosum]
MSAFILAAAPAQLASSADLHLLPFALSPTPPAASASTAAFFPFRGRAVAGQRIELPRGYRGVVLRADGLPGAGAAADSNDDAAALTATTSSHAPAPGPGEASTSASGRTTRSAGRAKGSGQVALSRPRRAGRQAVKRIKVDEEDEEDDVVAPLRREADARAKPAEEDVPRIEVVRATPEPEVEAEAKEEAEAETETSVAEVNGNGAAGDDAGEANATEMQVDTTTTPTTTAAAAAEIKPPTHYPAGARVLVPSAAFSAFMLWTPDAPLAGFDADELNKDTTAEADPKPQTETNGTNGTTTDTDSDTKPDADADVDAGAPAPAPVSRLEPSWWRKGGAGEGGDEFVRALGEFIGLGEIIHKRVYEDDDDDDDDDEE